MSDLCIVNAAVWDGVSDAVRPASVAVKSARILKVISGAEPAQNDAADEG